MSKSRLSGKRRSQRGQALAEFAVAVPIAAVLIIGLFDFGRVVWASGVIANASREAARVAVVHGGSASTACPVGPPAPTAVVPAPSSSCPFPSPSKQLLINTATQQAIGAGGSLAVAVCYGLGCSGSADTAGADNARGTPVTVTTTATLQLVIGALLGMGAMPLSSHATMIVSH